MRRGLRVGRGLVSRAGGPWSSPRRNRQPAGRGESLVGVQPGWELRARQWAGEWAPELVTGRRSWASSLRLGVVPCSGPRAQVCCLFQRPAVTHVAGCFP